MSIAHCFAHFDEDAPRPPVPGEEDDNEATISRPPPRPPDPAATPRRSDLDLGYEPEGSASPAGLRWSCVAVLLEDGDGIALFRSYLRLQGRADLLDFWLACSGFRKAAGDGDGDGDRRRLRLAKAIYRKYVAGGAVSGAISATTRSSIRHGVGSGRLDAALFEQARAEVQALMEDDLYPLFLKSNVYLSHTHAAGESSPRGPTLLPTLLEDKEWAEIGAGHTHSNRLTTTHFTAASRKGAEQVEAGVGRELMKLCYIKGGCTHAPVSSTYDSEVQSVSSDADTISLTDSSVEGVPLYQHHKKQHRDSGLLPLPHISRTQRLPKDVHMEPQKFAEALVSRLETLQRERDEQRELEERLHSVHMEEECDDPDVSMVTSLSGLRLGSAHSPCPQGAARLVQRCDAHAENPESILDEHVQRVMRTPGCKSPRPTPNTHARPADTFHYGGSADSQHPATRGSCCSDSPTYSSNTSQSEEVRWRSEPQNTKQRLKCSAAKRSVCEKLTVAYYFCGEPIPYRTSVKGSEMTLRHFKELLTRKGTYRFYFKKASEEFDCGVVYEEVQEDDALLPIYEERIIGKVEKID